jgi:hypothetical protein
VCHDKVKNSLAEGKALRSTCTSLPCQSYVVGRGNMWVVERRGLIQFCRALTMDILHLGLLDLQVYVMWCSGGVTRVRAGTVHGSSHGRAKGFFLRMSRPALGPTQRLIQLVYWFSPGCEVAGTWSWPLISITEIMNQWSCTSAPPCILMAWTVATLPSPSVLKST